ncbi:MAG: hypothetical protein M1825_003958 [Sarcosagium campestre]|nr:MAG: hypothetical protein M1825_003958 [Sarcosagium campestre]
MSFAPRFNNRLIWKRDCAGESSTRVVRGIEPLPKTVLAPHLTTELATEPMVEVAAAPVTGSMTDTATDSTTESTPDTMTDPTTESTANSTTNLKTKNMTDSTTDSMTDTTTEPGITPAVTSTVPSTLLKSTQSTSLQDAQPTSLALGSKRRCLKVSQSDEEVNWVGVSELEDLQELLPDFPDVWLELERRSSETDIRFERTDLITAFRPPTTPVDPQGLLEHSARGIERTLKEILPRERKSRKKRSRSPKQQKPDLEASPESGALHVKRKFSEIDGPGPAPSSDRPCPEKDGMANVVTAVSGTNAEPTCLPVTVTPASKRQKLPFQESDNLLEDMKVLQGFLDRVKAEKAEKAEKGAVEKPVPAPASAPAQVPTSTATSTVTPIPAPAPVAAATTETATRPALTTVKNSPQRPKPTDVRRSARHQVQRKEPTLNEMLDGLMRKVVLGPPPPPALVMPNNVSEIRAGGPVAAVLPTLGAQDLAALTRANTRRNKGGAIHPKRRKFVGVTSEAQEPSAPEATSGRPPPANKGVAWGNELVTFAGVAADLDVDSKKKGKRKAKADQGENQRPKKASKREITVKGTPYSKRMTRSSTSS